MRTSSRRTSAVAVTLCLALLALGCGGEDSMGPSIPSIEGSYSGDWTLTVENQDNGQSATVGCPGSITVDSQSEGSFSGSYRIDAAGDCDTSDSGTIDGNVRSDGGVDVSLGSASGSSADFEDITGCVVTGGDSRLTGNAAGGSMTVDAAFFADCPDGSGGTFSSRWVFEFSGS